MLAIKINILVSSVKKQMVKLQTDNFSYEHEDKHEDSLESSYSGV